MVPWFILVAFLAFHVALSPWGIPTRFTLHSVILLHYANDKGPFTKQEQEKKSRPFWGDIFDKLRKALTKSEVKEIVAPANEDIEYVAGRSLDYEKEESTMKNDINATIEQIFSFSPELQHFHFSPSLQQILREMKIRAEEDMKTVGTFYRGENGGVGADKAVRIVYRGNREENEAEKEV